MENQLCPCGSNKSFASCHGSYKSIIDVAPQTITVAPPLVTRKLDLAGGQSCREGFECVDIWEGAQHRVDLTQYPWPFEDNSVAELHSSHYIEHIPMVIIDGKDALFRFFDECWRILVPDGWMTVIAPGAFSNGAFQDPTHRRFIVAQTFLYLSEEWRRATKLDHYNVNCNFGIDVAPIVSSDMNLRVPEVQQMMMNHQINQIHSFQSKIKKLARLPVIQPATP